MCVCVCVCVCLSVRRKLLRKNYWTDFDEIWVIHARYHGDNARVIKFHEGQRSRSQEPKNLQKSGKKLHNVLPAVPHKPETEL